MWTLQTDFFVYPEVLLLEKQLLLKHFFWQQQKYIHKDQQCADLACGRLSIFGKIDSD